MGSSLADMPRVYERCKAACQFVRTQRGERLRRQCEEALVAGNFSNAAQFSVAVGMDKADVDLCCLSILNESRPGAEKLDEADFV